jgi:S1-C subfamily serine protease
MKRTPLYSRSRHAARASVGEVAASPAPAAEAPRPASSFANSPGGAARPGSSASRSSVAPLPSPLPANSRRRRFSSWAARHERRLWAFGLLLLAAAWWWSVRHGGPIRVPLTPDQITELVRKDLQEKPMPSQARAAYEGIRGSVVRVVGLDGEADDGDAATPGDPAARNIGTGVVIVDNGTILTNLHVVQGAKKLKVTFADGTESDAVMIGAQAENDLAVLRAKTVPDDLKAATLRSTGDLQPGDEVMAVGFPFGIGPSASAGVVSGLKREFRSPDGKQMISNLIQFDAAANPGNSGGPLVTMDGAVVGIVTAILNPSKQRVFIGIGFAVPIENAAAAAGMPPF